MTAATALIDIPRLTVSSRARKKAPAYNPAKEYTFRYGASDHRDQPHVVKFSGGRSSGMLLFTLLENGILNPERGDVIVFNNTSAEHPATYDFVRRCQQLAEQQYGMPFFWTEFQTYEDAVGGEWSRLPSYRLVLPTEYSKKNPDGYHCRGEVFEEVLSWQRFVPNQFQRICTAKMKIAVTRDFLSDWFAMKPATSRLGHYYKNGMMKDDAIIRMHKKNRGAVPDDVLLEKTAFVRARPWFRPEQNYADFSEVARPFHNKDLEEKLLGDRVPLSGDDCVDYVAFVGFRGDEPARVARMAARNYDRKEFESATDPHTAVPDGEYVYAPLAEIGVGKNDVAEFWEKQNKKWRLQLPHSVNYSNCVYCFLKGSQTLADITANRETTEQKLPKKLRAQSGTPADLGWWVGIERKYGRNLTREKRKIRNAEAAGEEKFIGFWGMNGRLSYSRLAEAQESPDALAAIGSEESALPCDCTD